MPTEFYGLVQELDPSSPEARVQWWLIPSDIARATVGDALYKILKISSNQADVDTILSFMGEGDGLTQAKVMKKQGAKDGEIKWEVLM